MCIVVYNSDQLSSQCVLACNDELQVNLNHEGFFKVTPNLLFQGNISNCPNLGVELYDNNNVFIGDSLTCAQAELPLQEDWLIMIIMLSVIQN